MSSESPVRPERVRRQRFPDHTELVRGLLNEGREGDAKLHVMAAYRPALCAYFMTRFASRHPDPDAADSAVAAFFADRVGADGFLSAWPGDRPFRYWLLRAFVYHVLHMRRRERSEQQRRTRLDAQGTRVPRDIVRDRFDAEIARSLVTAAHDLAEQVCASEGRQEDWEDFVAHVLHGRSFNEIAEAQRVSVRQVKNRVRFARTRLRDALARLLAGPTPRRVDLKRETSRLMEALERCRS